MGATAAIAWVGGRILTSRRSVEALLSEDGRIVLAGSDEEVRRHRPTGAQTIDLAGRCVVPGFIDAHLHVGLSVLLRSCADLSTCRSAAEVVEVLRAEAARHPDGPVLGLGWDESHLRLDDPPRRRNLDRVATDRPVIAYGHSLHVATVNSVALDRLEGPDDSADGPGNRRRGAGIAEEGLLAESALRGLKPLEDEALAARAPEARAWFAEAASFGLTTIAPMSSTPDELTAVREVSGSTPPTVGMAAYLRVPEPIDERWRTAALGRSELPVVGLKVHADGALGPRTAWLSQAYEDARSTHGVVTADPDRLRAVAALADPRGLGLAVHAIGDAALLQTLRTLGAPGDLRLRIEHASVTPPETWTELQRVRPVVVVQPGFRQTDRWLLERLGPERARWTYAYRTLQRLGITLAGSSDAPVESLDPWAGMRMATTPRAAGPPGEELTPSEALALYTSGSAAALRDPSLGQLEAGASADLVVLASDSWETALSHGSRSVRATYRGGTATFVRA